MLGRAARPPHVIAGLANSIAIVTIDAGVANLDGSDAKYEIEIDSVLRGVVAQSSVVGPAGMKIGGKYVGFLNLANPKQDCGSLRIGGGNDPSAFEADN
jgi:hypothetical protein